MPLVRWFALPPLLAHEWALVSGSSVQPMLVEPERVANTNKKNDYVGFTPTQSRSN